MRPRVVVLSLALALVPFGCGKAPDDRSSRPLRVVLGTELKTLDPQVAFDDVSGAVLENIFEGLVKFDKDLRVTAGLALRWINPDETTWRFFLDPAARFPDGSSLHASDVKFSIERLRGLSTSELTGFAHHVVDAKVVDDLTIDLKTDTPIAILNSLAFIPIMNEAHVRAAGDKVGESPFGTGPYRLERWERGKSIVLGANERHHPAPSIRQVEFIVAHGDKALQSAVVREKPDLTLFADRGRLVEMRRDLPQGLRIVEAEGLGVFYVLFNLRPTLVDSHLPNPLRDVRVRRALAQATDISEIIRDAIAGSGRPVGPLVAPQVFGFDPTLEPMRFDLAAARASLAEAGQKPFDLFISVERGLPHAVEEALAKQWRALGIRVSLRELRAAELTADLDRGAFDVAIQGFACTSGDTSEILGFALHSVDPARGYGMGNKGAFRHPEVDAIAEDNVRIFDPKKRLDMLQRSLKIVSEELPLLPLFAGNDIYIVSDQLRWSPPVTGLVRVSEMSLAPPQGR
ncbi:MAG: ABC transporter substrate-binding protein [Vicinamibacteria bacterium]